jgi:hypothetical protein
MFDGSGLRTACEEFNGAVRHRVWCPLYAFAYDGLLWGSWPSRELYSILLHLIFDYALAGRAGVHSPRCAPDCL